MALHAPAVTNSGNSVRTTWDDLLAAGMTKENVFDMFKKAFGQRPKQVYLNEGICVEFQHYCNNYQGEFSYGDRNMVPATRVATTKTLENNTDSTVTMTAQLDTEQSKSASVTVTESSSVSFGNSITVGSETLGISSEISFNFTFENSVGSTKTTSETVKVSDQLSLDVKPHSKFDVDLETSWMNLNETFSVPIVISGAVGADFGERVEGHYYWFMGLPDNLQGTIHGNVNAAYNITGKIRIR